MFKGEKRLSLGDSDSLDRRKGRVMDDRLSSFKARYERFLKDGNEDPLALKAEAERLLAEAKARGDQNLVRALEEILIDLTFSVEETKCRCHMASRCRC